MVSIKQFYGYCFIHLYFKSKYKEESKKRSYRDFPGDPVWNPPSNAEDEGSILDPRTKMSHVVEQLSLWATTPESAWSGVHVSQLERSTHDVTKILLQLRPSEGLNK